MSHKIFYTVAGEGDPVLFIQGVGVVGSGWLPQTNELSKKYKTITFDNRGIGQSPLKYGEFSIESMAWDAFSVLDELGIKAAHIVGHSMGGVIAQQMALYHPERICSLSLLCTFAKGKQALKMNPRMLWLGIKSKIGTKRSRRSAFLQMLYSKNYLANHPSLDQLAQETGQLIGRDLADSPTIIMKQLKALSQNDLSSNLDKLQSIPTLLISGTEDPIARIEFGRELAHCIPGSKYLEWANASHGLVIEKHNEVNSELMRFFESSTIDIPKKTPPKK